VVNHHILAADLALKKTAGNFTARHSFPPLAGSSSMKRTISKSGHAVFRAQRFHFRHLAHTESFFEIQSFPPKSQSGKSKRAPGGGLLRQIGKLFKNGPLHCDASSQTRALDLIHVVEESRIRFAEESRQACDKIHIFSHKKRMASTRKKKWRIRNEFCADRTGRNFKARSISVLTPLHRMRKHLETIRTLLEGESEDEDWQRLLLEMKAYTDRLAESAAVLERILEPGDEGEVRWVSSQRLSQVQLFFPRTYLPSRSARNSATPYFLRCRPRSSLPRH